MGSESARTDSPRATTETKRPRSRSRQWQFRAIAVLLALLPFVLFELVLRGIGYGYDTHLIVPTTAAADFGSNSLNPAIDRAYFGRGDLPGPEPRPFQLPKPAGLYRIVVVGGSSVQGFPYPSELSFPRHLEIVLKEQNPDRRFEVLNAGITAISSYSEADIARQVSACSPDLVIVHSGHNEFYGVGGLTSAAGGGFIGMYPLFERARRTRTFQLCASFLDKPVEKNLLEALPTDIAIPLHGAIFTKVEQQYRGNLERVAEHLSRSHVPLLLTTVPSNLRDLSPMSTLRNPSLSTVQQQQQAQRVRRVTEHLSYGEYDKALPVLQSAREFEPGNALLAFRTAQCLENLHHAGEAARTYIQAADLDGCRFRAPSDFSAIVRDTAARHPANAFFCDVADELRKRSTLPAPGNDFFLEHVHYNIEGHWTVAKILGEFIQTKMIDGQWDPQKVPDPTRRDELLGLTPLDHLVADSFTLLALQTWPLKLSPDSKLQIEFVTKRMQGRYAGLAPLDQTLFADLSTAAMQQDLLFLMGSGYQAAGELEKAARMFAANKIRRPWDVRTNKSAAGR